MKKLLQLGIITIAFLWATDASIISPVIDFDSDFGILIIANPPLPKDFPSVGFFMVCEKEKNELFHSKLFIKEEMEQFLS